MSASRFHRPTRTRGFTLIELLIALAIFAILSALSYRALNSLFATREALAKESTTLRERALFFARIENDMAALMNRAVLNADGNPEPAFRLNAFTARNDDANVAFTRAGYLAAEETGSAPQRVGYRLREGAVELVIWNGLDNAQRAAPAAYPALKEVRELKWRALDSSGNWQSEWPRPGGAILGGNSLPDPFPRAVELTVVFATGEQLTRLFAMRRMDERLQ